MALFNFGKKRKKRNPVVAPAVVKHRNPLKTQTLATVKPLRVFAVSRF